MLEAHDMISRLARFIIVGMVLLLIISVFGYFWFRAPSRSSPNEANTNAIFQVVGEFGARLKDVPDSSEASLALQIADKGVGVRVVVGKRVLHTADGRDLAISKGSDGKETVSVYQYEAMYLQDELDAQYDIVRHEMSARTVAGVDANLKRLITDRLYQEFATYADVVPGKPMSGPYPETIRIEFLQRLDDASYTVKGNIILMTSDTLAHGGHAGETPVTLALKKANGTWLIDDVLR